MASRLIDEASFAATLEQTFSLPIAPCCESEPLVEALLTEGERAELARMTAPSRRDSWLRGRAALKRLQRTLGGSEDTARLRFPNARLSLSHSEGWALAVGSSAAALQGLGVDLELKAPPRAETARRFLNPAEMVWLRRMEPEDHPRLLLRLWTVKEATFKADPLNAGATLRDYGLADPGFVQGRARRGDRVFEYASFEVAEGFLSVAVLRSIQ